MTGLPPEQVNTPKTTEFSSGSSRRRVKSNGLEAIRSCAETTPSSRFAQFCRSVEPPTGRIVASWDIDERERHAEGRSGSLGCQNDLVSLTSASPASSISSVNRRRRSDTVDWDISPQRPFAFAERWSFHSSIRCPIFTLAVPSWRNWAGVIALTTSSRTVRTCIGAASTTFFVPDFVSIA